MTRVYYTRYASNFLLGFSGHKSSTIKIFEEIRLFLLSKLGFKINKSKSTFSHATKGCKFLEVILKWTPVRLINKQTNLKMLHNQLVLCKIKNLTIPTHDLSNEAIRNGFGVYKKSNKKLARATAKQTFCSLEKKTIVNYFNKIIKYLLNYYTFIKKKSTLWPIISLYRKSCALTLANKLKLSSASQVFNKFGRSLRITNELEKTSTSLNAYPISLKNKKNIAKI